jgi:hypothetical protein
MPEAIAYLRRKSILGLLAVGALVLASCAINRPTVTQLAPEPSLFMVAHPLRYGTNDGRHEIVVPAGFITDLASIPRVLWWWQAPHERTMAPAILHDYLYWEQSCTKDEADAVMYLAMLEVGMEGFHADRVYDGIRTKRAQDAWDKNKAARDSGESRFLTEAYARRILDSRLDPNATLVSIQAEAAKRDGLSRHSPPGPAVKSACQAALKEFNGRKAL